MSDFLFDLRCWWDEWSELVIAAIAMPVLLAGVVIGSAYGLARPSCYASYRDVGYDVRWSFFGGCQINVGGQWLPTDNYRVAQSS